MRMSAYMVRTLEESRLNVGMPAAHLIREHAAYLAPAVATFIGANLTGTQTPFEHFPSEERRVNYDQSALQS